MEVYLAIFDIPLSTHITFFHYASLRIFNKISEIGKHLILRSEQLKPMLGEWPVWHTA